MGLGKSLLDRAGVEPENPRWFKDPESHQWWLTTSAEIARIERETPTVKGLAQLAVEQLGLGKKGVSLLEDALRRRKEEHGPR